MLEFELARVLLDTAVVRNFFFFHNYRDLLVSLLLLYDFCRLFWLQCSSFNLDIVCIFRLAFNCVPRERYASDSSRMTEEHKYSTCSNMLARLRDIYIFFPCVSEKLRASTVTFNIYIFVSVFLKNCLSRCATSVPNISRI